MGALTASSPVARDHWGIFEFPSFSFSFPSLPARAQSSFPSSLSRASRVLAREFPNPHLALGKPVEEAGALKQRRF